MARARKSRTNPSVANVAAHIQKRFNELDAMLANNPHLQVIVAGNRGRTRDIPPNLVGDTIQNYGRYGHRLGTGIAMDSWGGERSGNWRQIVTAIDNGMHQIYSKYPRRVNTGYVGFDSAGRPAGGRMPGPNCIHVWGANDGNWNLDRTTPIRGLGQAAAMGRAPNGQQVGMFGIITMPTTNQSIMADDKLHGHLINGRSASSNAQTQLQTVAAQSSNPQPVRSTRRQRRNNGAQSAQQQGGTRRPPTSATRDTRQRRQTQQHIAPVLPTDRRTAPAHQPPQALPDFATLSQEIIRETYDYINERGHHLGDHAVRVALIAERSIELLERYSQTRYTDLEKILIKYAALYHDTGRRGRDGFDRPEWEADGARMFVEKMLRYFPDQADLITQVAQQAIIGKDEPVNRYNIAVNTADLIEVMRARRIEESTFPGRPSDYDPARSGLVALADRAFDSHRSYLFQYLSNPRFGSNTQAFTDEYHNLCRLSREVLAVTNSAYFRSRQNPNVYGAIEEMRNEIEAQMNTRRQATADTQYNSRILYLPVELRNKANNIQRYYETDLDLNSTGAFPSSADRSPLDYMTSDDMAILASDYQRRHQGDTGYDVDNIKVVVDDERFNNLQNLLASQDLNSCPEGTNVKIISQVKSPDQFLGVVHFTPVYLRKHNGEWKAFISDAAGGLVFDQRYGFNNLTEALKPYCTRIIKTSSLAQADWRNCSVYALSAMKYFCKNGHELFDLVEPHLVDQSQKIVDRNNDREGNDRIFHLKADHTPAPLMKMTRRMTAERTSYGYQTALQGLGVNELSQAYYDDPALIANSSDQIVSRSNSSRLSDYVSNNSVEMTSRRGTVYYSNIASNRKMNNMRRRVMQILADNNLVDAGGNVAQGNDFTQYFQQISDVAIFASQRVGKIRHYDDNFVTLNRVEKVKTYLASALNVRGEDNVRALLANPNIRNVVGDNITIDQCETALKNDCIRAANAIMDYNIGDPEFGEPRESGFTGVLSDFEQIHFHRTPRSFAVTIPVLGFEPGSNAQRSGILQQGDVITVNITQEDMARFRTRTQIPEELTEMAKKFAVNHIRVNGIDVMNSRVSVEDPRTRSGRVGLPIIKTAKYRYNEQTNNYQLDDAGLGLESQGSAIPRTNVNRQGFDVQPLIGGVAHNASHTRVSQMPIDIGGTSGQSHYRF